MKRFVVSTVLAAAVAFPAAGALARGGEPQQPQSQPSPSGEAQQVRDFDLRFIDMAILHAQRGLKMSQLAEQKAENPELKTKAREITGQQQQDIERLNAMRSQLYPDAPKMGEPMEGMEMSGRDMSGMHGEGMTGHMADAHPPGTQAQRSGEMPMRGANMMEQMKRLQELSGPRFDLEFANDMILHHEMQVRMWERAEKDAKHDEVRDFADKLVDVYKKDIADLQKFSGSASM